MTLPRCIHDLGVPPVQFAFNGSLAVAKYDFLYHVSDDVRPVSGQADQGTAALNQAAAAQLFAGVSLQAKTVNETDADAYFPVAVDVILEVDCVSDTYEVGNKVTFTEDSGGTFLENQKVEKTTNERLAIGTVLKRYGSATTRVVVRFKGNVTEGVAGGDTTSQFDTVTTPVLIFDGATGANEIRVPTNLADALSIEDSTGDILTIDTSTGAIVVNFAAAVRVNVAGDAQIGSATTDLVAFHGSTPTNQCDAYTQTFATADRTHSARTGVTMTVGDLSGTANGAMEAVGDTMGSNVGPAISNNFQELFETVNAVIADLADTAGIVNALVDDLQEKGLVG